ncbi:hypothetical protein ABZ864_41255 [Streptomyces sp. NPDC047082]|uniref:WD40 repeat domain-containing protein n=1 Tax=Streptomyces sp. NPDC047082 TaxID=3155259 RepID=UPI0033F5FD33
MTSHDAAREHALHDDGSSEEAVHARIAQALAAMGADLGGVPPHPYVRRHLARHAHRGGVLDDERVPVQALGWDTGGGIRGMLSTSRASGPRPWLTAWSVVEPFLADADVTSRMASLVLAYTALHHPRTPHAHLPAQATNTVADCPLTVLWADWQPAANVLTVLPEVALSLAVVPSSDSGGPCIAAGTADGSIHFLDANTTQPGTPQSAHTGEVRRLHVSAAGPQGRRYLISASTDGALRRWDAHHHTPLDSLPGDIWIDDITSCYTAQGELTVLSVNGRSELTQWTPPALPTVWNTQQRVVRGALATFTDEQGERLIVHAADQLTVYTSEGNLRTTHALATPVRAMAASVFEPGVFYCGHADGTLTIWSPSRGQFAATAPSHGEPVKDLTTFALDGRDIVAAALGSSICLWDPSTLTTARLTGHWDSLTAVAALPDDLTTGRAATLVSAAADATLRQWPAHMLRTALASRTTLTPGCPAAAALLRSAAAPLAASVHPAGIEVWDLHRGTHTSVPTSAPVVTTTWAQQDTQNLLLWSDSSHTLHSWDPATGRRSCLTRDSHARVCSMAASQTPEHGALLLAAGDDYRIRLWSVRTGSLLRTWSGHSMSVKATAAAAGPEGQLYLATAGTEGIVRLWDLHQREESSTLLRCDQGVIGALAINTHPAESLPPLLATGGDQATVRLWDLGTRTPLGPPLTGHSARVTALAAFTVNSRHTYVASAAGDGMIRIWEASTARCVLQLAAGAPVSRLEAHAQPDSDTVTFSVSGPAGVAVISLDFGHPALLR